MKPAILADIQGVLPEVLRGHLAGDAQATLRLAELIRRFSPQEALQHLDGLPMLTTLADLSVDGVRAATLLELNKTEETKTLLPLLPPGPRSTLLQARLFVAEGSLDQADLLLSSLIPTTDPEIEAEARSVRVRLRMQRGLPSSEELEQLDAFLAHHGAGLSQSLFRALPPLLPLFAATETEVLRRSRAELEAHYCRAVEGENVAPIPLIVHGIARAHPRDPDRFVSAILTVVALDWRLGLKARGWPIALYGLKIGERLMGPLPNLRQFVEALQATEPTLSDRLKQ